MSNFKMDDYVPVNERIEAFYAKWGDGTLQSEIVELTETRVTVKAYAYRNPDDTRPGIGHSSLEIPGTTAFTRGSEIENAETSAWGRAIAALGFEVRRGVSSREEVRNKQPERSRGPARAASSPDGTAPVQRSAEEQALLDRILAEPGMTKARMTMMADGVGVPKTRRANADELREMIARFIDTPDGVPTVAAGGGDGSSDLPAAPTDEELLAVTGGELIQPSSEAAAVPDSGASPLASEPPPSTVGDAIARAEARGKAKATA